MHSVDVDEHVRRHGLWQATLAAEDDVSARGRDHLVTAGLSTRVLYGKKLALSGAFGFDLGGGAPGGFTGDVGLRVGFGLLFGARSFFVGEVGAAGGRALGTTAVSVPVAARLEIDCAPHVRLMFDVERRLSAEPQGRATSAGIALRVGHGSSQTSIATGRGYFLGPRIIERDGIRFYGVVLGHSFEVSG